VSYRLRLRPYDGSGPVDIVDIVDLGECRLAAARRLRRHRNVMGYPVTVLERGRKWELETGDDAVAISDHEGIIAIEETPEPDPADDDDDDPPADLCGRCGPILGDGAFVLCDRCIDESCGACGDSPEECHCVVEDLDE
jgi:hypothetical protein